MISMINHTLGKKLASFLSKSPPSYQRFEDISLEDLAFVLEAGDIVLVEGDTRISTAIKYLTQSSWSHACLYVGGRDSEVRDLALHKVYYNRRGPRVDGGVFLYDNALTTAFS